MPPEALAAPSEPPAHSAPKPASTSHTTNLRRVPAAGPAGPYLRFATDRLAPSDRITNCSSSPEKSAAHPYLTTSPPHTHPDHSRASAYPLWKARMSYHQNCPKS